MDSRKKEIKKMFLYGKDNAPETIALIPVTGLSESKIKYLSNILRSRNLKHYTFSYTSPVHRNEHSISKYIIIFDIEEYFLYWLIGQEDFGRLSSYVFCETHNKSCWRLPTLSFVKGGEDLVFPWGAWREKNGEWVELKYVKVDRLRKVTSFFENLKRIKEYSSTAHWPCYTFNALNFFEMITKVGNFS